MTGTGVTQAVGLLLGTSGMGSVNGSNNPSGDGFSRIMDQTTRDSAGQMQGYQKENQAAPTKTPVKVDRTTVRDTREQVSGKTSDQGQDTTDQVENPQEAVEEAVAEVKDAIEEELGISEEELEAIMSELGLTQVDLLQPANVRDIVMAAAGETDGLSILTNESLYQDVQTLTGMVEEIVSDLQVELGVDDTAMADILQQFEENLNGLQMENTAEENGVEIPQLISQEETSEAVVTVQKEDTSEGAGEPALTEGLEGAKETATVEVKVPDKTSGKESDTGAHHESGNPFLQGWSRTGLDTTFDNTIAEQVEIPFETVDTRDVMNQVTEFMKAQVKPEITELNLRLHPETLGTLHVHLTAKEGVVTAQFTAENEAVRTVLEAQAAQLKENLNHQGVKVEAVEVTIASHGFERSFGENGGDNAGYEEPRKRGTRRIQLDDSVSLDEMDLSEEERIAAEMMEQNGNTVDYMA